MLGKLRYFTLCNIVQTLQICEKSKIFLFNRRSAEVPETVTSLEVNEACFKPQCIELPDFSVQVCSFLSYKILNL